MIGTTSPPIFARFYAIDEHSFEAFYRTTERIDDLGGLPAVLAQCADRGEEADLMDLLGGLVARVLCDGSIVFLVAAPA